MDKELLKAVRDAITLRGEKVSLLLMAIEDGLVTIHQDELRVTRGTSLVRLIQEVSKARTTALIIDK